MKISVIAHPNSKSAHIEKDLLGVYHVYIHEPPLESKANKALLQSLARFFKVKGNQIFLVSGAKSKNKIYEVCL